MKNKKVHIEYAWIVLTALCLSQGAVVGIINNCAGLFFVPVSEEFKCGMSGISFSATMTSLFTGIALLTVSKKLLLKYPVKIVLAAANLLLLTRIVLCFTNSIVSWWIFGAIAGIGASFLSGMATNIVLERWFLKRLPTALSIVAAFSGIMGIVMSYVIGVLIDNIGWRPALLVSTLTIFVLVLPTFLISLNPSELGKKPYGYSEENGAGSISAESANNNAQNKGEKIKCDGRLIWIIVLCVMNAAYTSFIPHLAPLGTSMKVGFSASLIVTFYMIGNLIFKLLYGYLVEKKGLLPSSMAMLVLVFAGLTAFVIFNNYAYLPAGLLFGASALIYTTMIPLLEKQLYTSEQYPTIVQIGLVTYTVAYAVFGYVYGLIFDAIDTYIYIVIFLLILVIINAIIIFRLLHTKAIKNVGNS